MDLGFSGKGFEQMPKAEDSGKVTDPCAPSENSDLLDHGELFSITLGKFKL